jgi:8-oxo-dGTP diphosphatase
MTSDKKKIVVVAAAIYHDNQILIARRSSQQDFSGKWEFPGGKVEKGEIVQQALQREIKEELGCVIQVGAFIAKSYVDIANKCIEMSLFQATIVQGEPKTIEHQELRWICVEELLQFQWAPADIPLLGQISDHFKGQVR